MELIINGQLREFETLHEGSTVADLLSALALQVERVALERNGEIIARTDWAEAKLTAGDRLEIVHFVGGGREEPGVSRQTEMLCDRSAGMKSAKSTKGVLLRSC